MDINQYIGMILEDINQLSDKVADVVAASPKSKEVKQSFTDVQRKILDAIEDIVHRNRLAHLPLTDD